MKSVEIDEDKLFKLMSAQIVLDVLDKSFKIISKSKIQSDKMKSFKNNKRIENKNTKDSIDYVKNRKYFNEQRWNCISRPQYKYSCGISSVVSCWNYLYSTLGYGTLSPLTQEEALEILGFEEPSIDNIRFGPFTGNATLMRWFQELNNHFGLFGKASFFYKPVGADKTIGITGKSAKNNLQTLLKSKESAFIYHCSNHYCCPIGFEREPVSHNEIYTENKDANQSGEFLDWFMIADTSRKHQQFHCIKWENIDKDLNMKSPDFINVRHLEKGIQQNGYKKKAEKNMHCIIQSKKLDTDPFVFNILPEVSKDEDYLSHEDD